MRLKNLQKMQKLNQPVADFTKIKTPAYIQYPKNAFTLNQI